MKSVSRRRFLTRSVRGVLAGGAAGLLLRPGWPGNAAAAEAGDGFIRLFNGVHLAGWVPVNVAPGTFSVRDGLIVSTGIPTGIMRTEGHYENFELELEWRHLVSRGNAGLFVYSEPITAPGLLSRSRSRSRSSTGFDGRRGDRARRHLFDSWRANDSGSAAPARMGALSSAGTSGVAVSGNGTTIASRAATGV